MFSMHAWTWALYAGTHTSGINGGGQGDAGMAPVLQCAYSLFCGLYNDL